MRFDRLLAGSAIALVLAASVSAQAGSTRLSAQAGLTSNLNVAGGRTVQQPAFASAKEIERSGPASSLESPKAVDTAEIPMIDPAEVAITAADIALATKPESAPENDLESAPIRLTSIPGARVEANADPDATSAIMPVTPATAIKPATPAPAATAPETSAPATPMPPELALSPFGEKLRSLMAESQAARMFSRETLSSLSSFYAARSFEPLWTDKGAMTDRAKAALAQLKSADDDGLDAADYKVPTLEANASADALADFELKFTDAVIDYARHAAVGRVHWSRVARDIVYQTEPPAAADVLTKLSAAADVRAALDSYNPQHQHYKALKAKLAELRGKKDKVEEPIAIGSGPTLKVGMTDDRVPALRERLGVGGAPSDTAYDEALAEAVKNFQKAKKLVANGKLTPATVEALNGKTTTERGSAHTVDVVLANLERWRWIPHDLGESHVIVNIPEFMLRVYNKGSILWQTRVVVGKTSTPTPLLTETMKFITVNPTWNVPPSIVYGEYLPALRQDPTVLARMGLRVSYNRDGGVHISQPPGAGNALGRIRFNFPNKFLVYQHDTPDKYMFAHDRRAYSHGCMRIQNPDEYAEALLSIALPEQKYTAARIRGMYGHGEVDIKFPTPIPVHLTYQTAYVDAAGKLVLRDDVYGRDSRTIASLKSDNNERIASPAPEPARRSASSRSRRQVYREPVPQRSGFNFFGLFR